MCHSNESMMTPEQIKIELLHQRVTALEEWMRDREAIELGNLQKQISDIKQALLKIDNDERRGRK